ncbi:MAG TPA: NADPH-dependent FMN reductase [Gammaproteobacteria bacterium]|jgi:chromate reductase|nr:NADPH-dependent FMN reductase [Gammaproteobacteria bacterium]HET7587628.1 NADPH-dependent FMN reductase [Gammaproteobacteria bacterium]
MLRHTNILALPGSLRRGSYNRALLNAAAELAPPGMAVHVHDDLAAIPLFNEDVEHGTFDGPVRELRQMVSAADGVLIATPEYNQSVPGVLKNVIDWLSRPAPVEVLAGKPVAVIGASTGAWGTRLAQSTLRQVLYAVEALVLPGPAMFVRDAEWLFDEGRLVDQSTRDKLAAVLTAFGAWI